MINKLRALYSILIAVCMIGMWGFLLATGNVPEMKSEPIGIAFHLFSEYATAGMLLISGFGMLAKRAKAEKLFLISTGALLYSVLNAVGYYGQDGNLSMLIMFSVIFILAVYFVIQHFYSKVKN
jgi:hypothetical protein